MTRVESLIDCVNRINNSEMITNDDAVMELLIEVAYSIAVLTDKLLGNEGEDK